MLACVAFRTLRMALIATDVGRGRRLRLTSAGKAIERRNTPQIGDEHAQVIGDLFGIGSRAERSRQAIAQSPIGLLESIERVDQHVGRNIAGELVLQIQGGALHGLGADDELPALERAGNFRLDHGGEQLAAPKNLGDEVAMGPRRKIGRRNGRRAVIDLNADLPQELASEHLAITTIAIERTSPTTKVGARGVAAQNIAKQAGDEAIECGSLAIKVFFRPEQFGLTIERRRALTQQAAQRSMPLGRPRGRNFRYHSRTVSGRGRRSPARSRRADRLASSPRCR